MGKWHLGYEPANGPTRHGFDEFVGHSARSHRLPLAGSIDMGEGTGGMTKKLSREQGHNTTLITQHSVRFIKRASGQAVLSLCFTLRDPFSLADDSRQSTPGSRARRYEDAVGKLGPHAAGPVQPVVQGMIEELDASVGEILTAIKEQKLAKRTLVFFTSDNGGIVTQKGLPAIPDNRISDNSPWRGQKHGLYEGGHPCPGHRMVAGQNSGQPCFP